jgi:hypothetical protein
MGSPLSHFQPGHMDDEPDMNWNVEMAVVPGISDGKRVGVYGHSRLNVGVYGASETGAGI